MTHGMPARPACQRFGAFAMRLSGAVAAVSAVSMLAACATPKPKPTPLEVLAPASLTTLLTTNPLTARVQWTVKLDRINAPLVLGVSGNANDSAVVMASSDGTVVQLQADTGREVWRTNVGTALVAGVGSDGTRAAVVTRDNELVLLDNGTVRWRKALSSRVSSPPLVAGERVFVLAVDRNVQAFDALEGTPLWTLSRPGEALGLLQSGVVAPFGNTLLVGQGARLAAIDPNRGSVTYEVPMASPRGTNEIERLADLVGPAARVGDVVCARAFQSAVGCVQADRGALIWSKNVGGTQAVGADRELVAGADATDRVTAWRAASGDTAWTHERLLHRGLSGFALTPKAVVVGDVEGYLHFFDRATGATLQRIATDGSPVIGTPRLVGRTLVVVNRSGAVHGVVVE
jgi:outer membrane protein assembly factor BamB